MAGEFIKVVTRGLLHIFLLLQTMFVLIVYHLLLFSE